MTNQAHTSIALVKSDQGETFRMGPYILRVMEDGSKTDMRIGAIELTIPPHTSGPPQHWHEMHDETFLVTQGTIRFTTLKESINAKAGDYVVVPPRAKHTFSNPSDEEGKFFNTFTPAFYVNYFRLLKQMATDGVPITEKISSKAMSHYATLLVDKKELE